MLAEWDADMEETDSIRRGRPLMHAANNGHTAAVKAMIECGADPEATDDNGYTALMVAVFSDRCGSQGSGGSVSSRTQHISSITSVECCASWVRENTPQAVDCQLADAHGTRASGTLPAACVYRSSAAEVLVDGGACVDAQDRAGRTALSYAAMYGSTDCIYLLAARGADVGHIDADGNTPLELAEGSGRQSAVDALKKLQLRVKMQEKRKVGPSGLGVCGLQCRISSPSVFRQGC